MELLLNILWFLVASGIGALTARHQRTRSDETPGAFTVAVAVICVIFLLFPAISISDDLHDVNGLMEDSWKSVSAFVQLQPMVLAAVVLFSPFELPRPAEVTLRKMSEEFAEPCTLDGHSSPAEGRGPPSSPASCS